MSLIHPFLTGHIQTSLKIYPVPGMKILVTFMKLPQLVYSVDATHFLGVSHFAAYTKQSERRRQMPILLFTKQ